MKAIYTLVPAIILLTAVSAVAQGKLKIDPESRYLLLSTIKTSTMQKELDEASAQGFRIMSAASSCGQSEMVLFLERVTQPPDTYKYRLLATTRVTNRGRASEAEVVGRGPSLWEFDDDRHLLRWTLFQSRDDAVRELGLPK